MPLGPAKDTVIEVVDEGPEPSAGFLRVRRPRLRQRWPDGSASPEYEYNLVERDAMDGVAILLYTRAPVRVCLRTAIRPPLAFRPSYNIPLPSKGEAEIWEIPAGLVEPDEKGDAGLRACAAWETLEEVGLELAPTEFHRLGEPIYLSPGVLAEMLHFYAAEVVPESAGTPTEDGSPLEQRASIEFVALDEAYAALESGLVRDAKSEVGLRRLMAWLNSTAGDRK